MIEVLKSGKNDVRRHYQNFLLATTFKLSIAFELNHIHFFDSIFNFKFMSFKLYFTLYFIFSLIKSHLKGIMFPNTIYISLYCTFFIHRCIRIYLKSRSRMSLYIRGKSIFYAMRIIIEIVVHICNCVGKSFVMSF